LGGGGLGTGGLGGGGLGAGGLGAGGLGAGGLGAGGLGSGGLGAGGLGGSAAGERTGAAGEGPREGRPEEGALLGELGAGAGAFGAASRTRLVADPGSNTVVVQTTRLDWPRIEAALRRLDQVPLQVLIEATIAEVTLNDRLRFGLQVAVRSGNFAVNFTPDRSRSASFVASEPGNGRAGRLDDTLLGLLGGYLSVPDARVLLDALSSITTVNVISSPQLMVLSNQTATLQVGDQVPIATQSALPVESFGGRIVNSIQLRDTGVILRVTPRVNSSGLIGMDIEQEVSDVVPTESSGIDSPTIRQRRVQSTVAVQSGETVALGGLIRRGNNRTRSGLPGLRDVPVLGQLIGSTDTAETRTELLVLLTPRIVRSSEEARSLTAELRARLTGFEPLPASSRPDRLPPPPRAP
jgi:general secretion pathway protein D